MICSDAGSGKRKNTNMKLDISVLEINANFFKYLCQELFRVKYMAERYCGVDLSREDVDIIIKSVDMLAGLSEKDGGSDEVLRFGSMVEAEKVQV